MNPTERLNGCFSRPARFCTPNLFNRSIATAVHLLVMDLVPALTGPRTFQAEMMRPPPWTPRMPRSGARICPG